MQLLSGECIRTPLIIGNWFWWWLCAIRQQAITRANDWPMSAYGIIRPQWVDVQGSFYECAQPLRDDVTIISHWLDAFTKWSLEVVGIYVYQSEMQGCLNHNACSLMQPGYNHHHDNLLSLGTSMIAASHGGLQTWTLVSNHFQQLLVNTLTPKLTWLVINVDISKQIPIEQNAFILKS